MDKLAADGPLGADPLNLAAPMLAALRTQLGLQLDRTETTVDPNDFDASGATAASLALATLVTGETVAALRTLGNILQHLGENTLDLDDIVAVIRQIERITGPHPGKPPSAYSIAKLLLILSRDADAPAADPPAAKLVRLIGGNGLSPAEVAEGQMLLGLALMALGSVIDRAFDTPAPSGEVVRAPLTLPANLDQQSKTFTLAQGGGKKLDLQLGYEATPLPARLYARLDGSLDGASGVGGDEFRIRLHTGGSLTVQFDLPVPPVKPFPRPKFSGDIDVGIGFDRKSSAAPLVLGKADGTHFSVGDLSGAIRLHGTEPRVEFDLKDSKLVLRIGDDPFLGALIGERVEVALAFGLVADKAGGLRLKDGTGLKATIPLEQLPGSPVQIPFLTFELTKPDGLNTFEVELSGSFQVRLGPFAGSIDRLGSKLSLTNMLAGVATTSWGLKPPSGAGLSLDAGVVKGGGFLLFDPGRGEYGGVLDLKLMAIGVKAIGLLSTKNPGGWSLLLVIAAQLPPIQLGFGFTLTGLGGLLGVQHTVSLDALRTGLATGSLDGFLFPQNPVANAPQIINQLRVIFPFKAGGFVIGPMLELGWGTPSLVTAHLGVLIEATQFVFVGQVIVQLPPRVDKALALLRLQVDFAGDVVFDPLQIWFDGVLRDSRVLFISLTGQFAFRAVFGDEPSFLLSAGGFHPRYTDLPPGLPSPFQRVGAEFSIGIVGLQFKGYFAVTSSAVMGGSSMRVWGDVGIAAFEGGFEFNALIVIAPRFHFDVDIHVWAGVEVFGIDFASVDIHGMLSGPGRWHIVGRATIHTPWPLPDFGFHVDESWGEDRDTPVRRFPLLDVLLPELAELGNWSAQLAQVADSFITLAPPARPGQNQKAALLAHPNAVLRFVQKRLPLATRLDKLGSDGIEGANQIGIAEVVYGPDATAPGNAIGKRVQTAFAAAQFLNRSEDEQLAKPAFDPLEAGFEIGLADYAFGAGVGEPFDYEEANLSKLPGDDNPNKLVTAGFTGANLATMLDRGAAGRSERRRAARLRPDEIKLKVNPPPLAVLDAGTGTMVATPLTGMAASSFWHADAIASAAGKGAVVVESFEMAGF